MTSVPFNDAYRRMDVMMTVRLLLIEIRLVVYPKVTSVLFNDAYRYMDWLPTMRLLLIEKWVRQRKQRSRQLRGPLLWSRGGDAAEL